MVHNNTKVSPNTMHIDKTPREQKVPNNLEYSEEHTFDVP